jgi:Kef-type K+ transport system membrane component KefB
VLVLAAATLAAFLARIDRRIVLPTVILELVFGIALGPQVTGWATADSYIRFLADLGLAMLFFFAGVEVIERRVASSLLLRGSSAWGVSLVLGIAAGYALHEAGVNGQGWLIGIALSTTSLGMLVPILADAGVLSTPLGKAVLGTGVAGEFWPIIVISVALTGVYGAGAEVVLLFVFGVLAAGAAGIALRARPPRVIEILRETLDSTGQAAVRLSVLVLAALVLIARDVGFDFVLGAFTAGLILGIVFDSPEGRSVRMRLEGIGFGLLIPIYFVTTGLTFDLDGLLSVQGLAYGAMFLALLLVVHTASALLWRRSLGTRRTASLALFTATGLPLIVATVGIGIGRGAIGTDVGASLIGAGMVSVLVFPLLGMRVGAVAATVERPGR